MEDFDDDFDDFEDVFEDAFDEDLERREKIDRFDFPECAEISEGSAEYGTTDKRVLEPVGSSGKGCRTSPLTGARGRSKGVAAVTVTVTGSPCRDLSCLRVLRYEYEYSSITG